jgi:hypothetical protein
MRLETIINTLFQYKEFWEETISWFLWHDPDRRESDVSVAARVFVAEGTFLGSHA